jgi:hypothetical protein
MFFDAGGGHRAAATALEAVIAEQRRPWIVRKVNLQEYLDRIDIFRKLTGVRLEDVYNNLLKKGWTLGSEYLIPPMHWAIRAFHRQQVRLLTELWRADPVPDMVVSVVPNLNRAMFQALQAARPGTPYVTIVTDLADYPPHFWMERQPQAMICGTERARDQARAMGYRAEDIFLTSGMILRPMFYNLPAAFDRAAERARLGLHPTAPLGLVLFGGQGSRVMWDIVERLDRPATPPGSPPLQLILICGRNEALAAKLRARTPRNIRIHVEGFTTEIPRFMRMADFFIGKPGPGSISEAIALGLPVIVECNAWTLPQERYNTVWVGEKQVGFVLQNFREIAGAVDGMLAPGTLERLRANAQAIDNRAVYEIPEILAGLLARRDAARR